MSRFKDRERGLYQKYVVRRTDGRDAPGETHDGCEYFVLDLTHDPHALPALRAYADSCRGEYPKLCKDLMEKWAEWGLAQKSEDVNDG
ncbi:MAG: hypothetical protein ACYTEX_11025 [Planctomycetota bacterium]|jgi:hypothetical protein